jgi:hypothetical protein
VLTSWSSSAFALTAAASVKTIPVTWVDSVVCGLVTVVAPSPVGHLSPSAA